MTRTTIVGAALLAATSAFGQTGSNVTTPRAEGQVGAINQSIISQQQNRAATQQNQFEVNSLRGQINQPIVQGPGLGGTGLTIGAIRR